MEAARIGGIHANNTYPAEFIQQNLTIQTNALDMAHRYIVKNCSCLSAPALIPNSANSR
ncbi:NAD-dependent epimerase/dehydratase family protein [Nitrospina gracilis]|uniref:NAD-dependent epimerase/dehydratase family protein n=1 Tax=Nitrospina gracilis TaxID=35801 RepID=UPI001EFFC5B8